MIPLFLTVECVYCDELVRVQLPVSVVSAIDDGGCVVVRCVCGRSMICDSDGPHGFGAADVESLHAN